LVPLFADQRHPNIVQVHVADKVVRRAACPVLTLRWPFPEEGTPHPSTNGSEKAAATRRS
jgi:hypothetical protein